MKNPRTFLTKAKVERWQAQTAEIMLGKIHEKLTSILSQTVAKIESLKHKVNVLGREAEGISGLSRYWPKELTDIHSR